MEKYTQDKMYEYFIKYIDKVSNQELEKLNKELSDLKQNALSLLNNQLNEEYSALFKREEEKAKLALLNEKRLISNSYNIKFQENLHQYYNVIKQKLNVYLSTYIETKEYQTSMIKRIDEILLLNPDETNDPLESDFDFEISSKDTFLETYLLSKKITPTKSNIIGGFRATSHKGILIDESFDDKLTNVDNILFKLVREGIYSNEQYL
jgi:hypothetical protein